MAHFVVVVSLTVLLQIGVSQGQIPTVSDPQALTLAAQSIAALSKGTTVADVKLTASITSIEGPDPIGGTATLLAKGTEESRIDTVLSGITSSEIRSSPGGNPQGTWTDKNAKANRVALHNCLTDAVWFFPALSSLTQSSNPKVIFSFVGEEKHAGLSVLHLTTNLLPTKGTPDLGHLTTTDFYLDPVSLLPLAVAFNVHPDDDLTTDIPNEIRFAKYQSVNGVQVPFHIQRILNGGVLLDVVVSNAVINSGLPDASFDIQ